MERGNGRKKGGGGGWDSVTESVWLRQETDTGLPKIRILSE